SHTITAQITDSIGLIGQTAIVLTIADRPPDVRISTPLDAAIFAPAFPIVFNATATDNIDGDLGANIAWTSDRQGALGTGRTITVSNLSDGDHVITAQVTN